jgi:hypothetical protein
MGSAQSIITNDETFGEDGHFKVHIKLHEGFNPVERLKLRDACRAWVEVWHDNHFREWLMSFQFSDEGHSNREICNKLLGGISGAKVVDNQADIEIWGRHNNDGTTDAVTIKTTFVHDGKQWEGSTRLMTYTVAKIAGFLVYDYCRHQGFHHAGTSEERTVPFAVAKETKRLIEEAFPALAEAHSEERIEAQQKALTEVHSATDADNAVPQRVAPIEGKDHQSEAHDQKQEGKGQHDAHEDKDHQGKAGKNRHDKHDKHDKHEGTGKQEELMQTKNAGDVNAPSADQDKENAPVQAGQTTEPQQPKKSSSGTDDTIQAISTPSVTLLA